ncbi:MAG: MFS transporter [Hyphomicrobiales bacterium]|nr:MFS transporter [Hyphomicrobiales bacterium]
MSYASAATVARSDRRRTLLGGAIGHFIEWYDWSIYGFLAAIFAAQMFPASDLTASLIASFLAFALGFLGRPIGAFVLSPLADKYGRRALLSATIIMTGIGSLAIALCPTYAQIGVVAPLLITAARLLQGFSAGGEYQIAASFLNEHGATERRALDGSPQQISIGLAVLAATGIASLTTKIFSAEQLTAFGWRMPFVVGALLSLYGLYLRFGIAETSAFRNQEEAQSHVSVASIVASIAQFPRQVFIVFVIQLGGFQYYLWMIFLPTYANLVGGLDRASGFTGSILASVAYCIGVPAFAHLSDRWGRRPFLIGSAACFLLFSYPLLKMLAVPNLSFGTFAFVAVVGALFIALNNGVIGTVFAELFPTRVRASGIGIPYAVSAAIFGGTAPVVTTWLHQAGGPLYVALYIMLICAIAVATHVFLTPETRGKPLE